MQVGATFTIAPLLYRCQASQHMGAMGATYGIVELCMGATYGIFVALLREARCHGIAWVHPFALTHY